MNEQETTPKTPETTASDSTQSAGVPGPEPISQNTVNQDRLTMKDFLIPASIVVAGVCIGIGLYFSGGQSTGSAGVQPAPSQPRERADTTDQVAPVTEDDYVKGNRNAPVMVVEYSDFDCPFCSRFHDVMNEIVAENDNVAWTYRHFPIEQLHPNAPAVAVASECVGSIGGQDAFWAFTDGYFAARGAGDQTAHATLIPQLVAEAGVEVSEWQTCFESGELVGEVQADLDNAVATGGRGTPWSVLIGPDGETYPINGALPKQAIEQLITTAIESAG